MYWATPASACVQHCVLCANWSKYSVWKQQHANTANVRRRRQRFEWRLRSRVFKYLKCRTRISTTVNCTRHSCWCFLKKQQQKKREGLFLAPPLTAPRDRDRKQTWIYTLLNLWMKPRPNVENRIVYCQESNNRYHDTGLALWYIYFYSLLIVSHQKQFCLWLGSKNKKTKKNLTLFCFVQATLFCDICNYKRYHGACTDTL